MITDLLAGIFMPEEFKKYPDWNFSYKRTTTYRSFLRSKTVVVGKESGKINVYKVNVHDLDAGTTTTLYEIETCFGESTTIRCREHELIDKLKTAEENLIEKLKKGKQPTIIDKLTELGYK